MSSTGPAGANLRRLRRRLACVSAFFVCAGILQALQPEFLSAHNLRNMLLHLSAVGPIVLGQSLLLVMGRIDASIGAVAGLSALVAAKMLAGLGAPLGVAIVIALAAGIVAGLLNGLVAIKTSWTPAVTATVGMLLAVDWLAFALQGPNGPILVTNEALLWLGGGSVLGVPVSLILLLTLMAGVAGFLRSALGRRVYDLPGGPGRSHSQPSAGESGLTLICFCVAGILASAGGIITLGQLTTVDAGAWGRDVELQLVVAALLGGASLWGGVSAVPSALLGGLLFVEINDGMHLLNQPWWPRMGVVIGLGIVAVSLDRRFPLGPKPYRPAQHSPTLPKTEQQDIL